MGQILISGTAESRDVRSSKTFSAGVLYGASGSLEDKSGVALTADVVSSGVGVLTVKTTTPNDGFIIHTGTTFHILDPDFIAANFPADKNIFGMQGAIIVRNGNTITSGGTEATGVGDLIMVPPQGIYDGQPDTRIRAFDANFIPANFLATKNMFGMQGAIPVKTVDQTTDNVITFNNSVYLRVPKGYWDGNTYVFKNDPNFAAANFPENKNIFGMQGAMPVIPDNWESPAAQGYHNDLYIQNAYGYSQGFNLRLRSADYAAANIKRGVKLWGLDGALEEGFSYTIEAFANLSRNSEIRALDENNILYTTQTYSQSEGMRAYDKNGTVVIEISDYYSTTSGIRFFCKHGYLRNSNNSQGIAHFDNNKTLIRNFSTSQPIGNKACFDGNYLFGGVYTNSSQAFISNIAGTTLKIADIGFNDFRYPILNPHGVMLLFNNNNAGGGGWLYSRPNSGTFEKAASNSEVPWSFKFNLK